MNDAVTHECPGCVMIAEESTAWPKVTGPTAEGGLGFNLKWNMGWMHDSLDYMSYQPVHRKYHQDLLTFGPLYAFNEHFMLPLSHDEVVHLKKSLFGRMPGDEWQQFSNLRLLYSPTSGPTPENSCCSWVVSSPRNRSGIQTQRFPGGAVSKAIPAVFPACCRI